MLSAAKEAELQARMDRLGITDEDLTEKFIRGSGHGGQKINKTSSCVYLKHEPSGIEIKCQQERSQTMNRYLARVELCEQLEARREKEVTERRQARLCWLRTPRGVAPLTVPSRLPLHGRTRKRSPRRSGARRAAATKAKS